MKLLDYIFQIGVILAIYNFLWWIINMGLNLLRGGRPNRVFEVYLIKAVRYLFLANVIFLSSTVGGGSINLFIAGSILLMYMVGRIQKKQQKQSLFQMQGNINMPGMENMFRQLRPIFDIRYERGVVLLVMAVYAGFYFLPGVAHNNVANWFLKQIQGIEAAPIFGFIFKVIGFFFMLNVVLKVFNGLMILLGPKSAYEKENNDDQFDDYTEIK